MTIYNDIHVGTNFPHFHTCMNVGFAMSWSPVQGVLPTVLDLVTVVKRKVSWRRPRPELGCRAKGKEMSVGYFMAPSFHAPAALSPGKSRRYPFYRRLGGPQSRSGRYGEVKYCFYIAVNFRMMDELEMIWQEATMTQVNGQSGYLSTGSEDSHEELQSGLPVSSPRFEPNTSWVLV
jgi:hypothetical protein